MTKATQDLYPYSVKITHRTNQWVWCCKHFEVGTWKESQSLDGSKSTFWFVNEGDALLFRLSNEL